MKLSLTCCLRCLSCAKLFFLLLVICFAFEVLQPVDCGDSQLLCFAGKTKFNKHIENQGLPGFIKISGMHNHSNSNLEALSFLPSSQGLRNVFEEYFSSGMGIAEAMTFHRHRLEMSDDFTESVLADATKNPKYRTVVYWHTTWLQFTTADLGPLTESTVTSMLREKVPGYHETGCRVLIDEDPFSVVVLTPIMSRAHELPEAGRVCFVDSNTSCGAQNMAVTFLLTPCSAGAVPLAVVVTAGQSEDDYACGFRRLRESGCSLFGGNGYPSLFMTEDNAAARNALRSVWPLSQQSICPFQMALASWRWLWDADSVVAVYDRPVLMAEFRSLMQASTSEHAEANYYAAMSSTVARKYAQWLTRLQACWERKDAWCAAWRPRGYQSSMFGEVSVRLFRDNVLSQAKAYNPVALVEYVCTTMEQFCSRRLMDFASSRLSMPTLWLGRLLEEAEHVCPQSVLQVSESVFGVPSASDASATHCVDILCGLCSCREGICGRYCEHLAAVVHLKTESVFPEAPAPNADSCRAMAAMALGDGAQDPAHFDDTESVSENGTDSPCNPKSDDRDVLWKALISLLNRHHRRFGNSGSGLRMMLKRLRRISSASQWETFMHRANYSTASPQ